MRRDLLPRKVADAGELHVDMHVTLDGVIQANGGLTAQDAGYPYPGWERAYGDEESGQPMARRRLTTNRSITDWGLWTPSGRSYPDAMGQSLIFGIIASSALIIGALIGMRFDLPKRLLAILLSFSAGALITALAFELFQDAYEKGGIWRAAVGLLVGALVFTVLSALLDRAAQPGDGVPADEHRGSAKLDTDAAASDARTSQASKRGAAGLALLAAVTLDGVPENLALGVSLGEGSGGLALLAAIFVSNLPEALVGASSMREQRMPKGRILALWSTCAALLVGAVVLGAGPLAQVDDQTISLPLAFAAGAVIASLADTLMPEAYEHGGPAVAMSTAAGFVLSFVLSLT